jgi:AraC family transcriptional regulator
MVYTPSFQFRAEKRATPYQGMSSILDRPPVPLAERLTDGTQLTGRWIHGPVHDSLPAMSAHTICAIYGGDSEITLKRAGKLRLRSYTKKGTIVLIPTDHDGQWDIAGPTETSHVYLTPKRLQTGAEPLLGCRPVELLDRVSFPDPTITRILAVLGDEATNDPSARLFLEQAIDLLCLQLVRAHSTFGALPEPAPKRGLTDRHVKRVTAYMNERMEDKIGLDELAALVNLSRFHFCTSFRQATGQSPYRWLTHLRMLRAKALLAIEHLPITEIAFCVGYQTPSSFAANFRKIVGVSPSEFRRKL